MQNKWITKKELAERWRCTVRHIDSLVRARAIPFTKIGRLIRFDLERVERALERFTQKAVGE